MDSDALKVCLVVGVIAAALFYRASVKGTVGRRITPYRDPLVPENFHRVCEYEKDRRTIVWILLATDQYSREIAGYMGANLGWKFTFVVPPQENKADPRVLEFYQRTEVEKAIQHAYCIFSGPGVIETAASTARNSKLPLVLVTSVGIAEWIPVAEKFTKEIYIVNSLRSADRVNSQLGRPSFLLPPPVFPKQFITHTSRKFITLVPYGALGVADEIVAAAPQFEFTIVGSKDNLHEVYSQTGILCVLETPEQFCRIAIEAAASGIPCVGTGGNGLKEAMGDAAIYVPNKVGDIVGALSRLKNDPLAYKAAADAAFKHAASLDPVRTFDEFSSWLLDRRAF
jgi:hypothetical protein